MLKLKTGDLKKKSLSSFLQVAAQKHFLSTSHQQMFVTVECLFAGEGIATLEVAIINASRTFAKV